MGWGAWEVGTELFGKSDVLGYRFSSDAPTVKNDAAAGPPAAITNGASGTSGDATKPAGSAGPRLRLR